MVQVGSEVMKFQNRYEMDVDGIICPVDGQSIKYNLVFTTGDKIEVEGILEWIEEQKSTPMFQEDFARKFAEYWFAPVERDHLTVTGVHSGVHITSEVTS